MFQDMESIVMVFAGVCSAFAVILSGMLIRRHLLHFSRPVVQGKIVGILWMVPIYAVDSFLSLRFKEGAEYVDMLRDCYEGYALYLFLALMVGYLGDGDEYKVVDILEECPVVEHARPFKWLLKGPVPHGRAFLRFAKLGVLQYSIIKPASAIMAFALTPFGLYKEGDFSLRGGWLYIVIVLNLSVSYAFYCLVLFYVVLKEPLKVHDPVPKFLCIKAVLFLSFWQGIIIAGLATFDCIHAIGSWTAENVQTGIQDLLICLEMLAVAIAHTSAFSYWPYVDGMTQRDRSSLLEAHFAHHSAIRDFNEVMPVLLPSSFRPGPARTVVRIPSGERGSFASWMAADGARSALFLPSTPRVGRGKGGTGQNRDAENGVEGMDSLRESLLSVNDEPGGEGDDEDR
ncbi:unnamed protein product [Choristocarpus tenellus]